MTARRGALRFAPRPLESAPMLPTPPSDPSLNPGLLVLVVDDSDDVAEMTAEMLRMYGHEACIANDGPSALAAVASERPDAVLLDLGLPGMNGLEVAEALHAARHEASPLVIAVSGYDRAEDRERLSRAGCLHHLVKPVDFTRILALLAAHAPARGD